MFVGHMRKGTQIKGEAKLMWVEPWLKKPNKRHIQQQIMKGNPLYIRINEQQLQKKIIGENLITSGV
jgi:hypothetical protein